MKKNKVCDNTYEHQYWADNIPLVGIDEAGRGPLAGPLTVAGVVFPIGYENPDIYDSKSLSEKKRDYLFDLIQNEAEWFEIIQVDEATIDRMNILEADRYAMNEIALHSGCEIILTDAMKLPIDKTVIDLVKGDQKSISIAAGSILAKVSRDRLMKQYDAIYPMYGFASNKGYGTKKHLEAIEQFGITPIHRRSYAPVKYSQQKLDI